jgi:hypothetical protein
MPAREPCTQPKNQPHSRQEAPINSHTQWRIQGNRFVFDPHWLRASEPGTKSENCVARLSAMPDCCDMQ